MPYVQRDDAGRIVGLTLEPAAGCTESVADDDPQLRAFVDAMALRADFARMDGDFVRVLEDLIEALVARHVIALTDLPERAQTKLMSRRALRERLTERALELLGDARRPDGGLIAPPRAEPGGR